MNVYSNAMTDLLELLPFHFKTSKERKIINSNLFLFLHLDYKSN